ncbi:hypothetical protein BU16DRAFT_512732 [Lophium mytilinum]|uniref:Rhodopsin domain-containing protein n=1 Tax=Lophium mytilinum TaxID=390894 RepID=A0A6A6QRD4_9PEZI|nr:hypothetical protein BU16DRAFT_512732 [Lophium mytilinum]
MTPEYIAFSEADQILAITGVFCGAAFMAVLLRIYVRAVMLKVFGSDDYLMVIAMVLGLATFGHFVAETHYGLGKHFLVMLTTPGMYQTFAKLLFFHSIWIMIAVSCVKISIALFLLRLSTRTPYKRFLISIIVFLVLFTITCSMTLIFQCIPVQAAWNTTLRPPPMGFGTAKCYSKTIFRDIGLFNSSINIATDILFATLPIPLVWSLKLNTRTKISLILILSLGFFASAAAIVKAVQQYNVLTDMDWTVHDSFNVWNYIELTVGIVAATLPSLKPLFGWLLNTARALTTAGSGNGGLKYGSGSKMALGYKRNNSLGYFRAGEGSGESEGSVAMESLPSRSGGDGGAIKSPYRVRVTAESSVLGITAGQRERDGSGSGEGGLPLQRLEAGRNGIVMTREVYVS